VPARLSAVERIRVRIDELFASDQDLGQVLEQVARLSVRLVMPPGLWGVWSGPAFGQIQPGLTLGGPLPFDASGGQTTSRSTDGPFT